MNDKAESECRVYTSIHLRPTNSEKLCFELGDGWECEARNPSVIDF